MMIAKERTLTTPSIVLAFIYFPQGNTTGDAVGEMVLNQ